MCSLLGLTCSVPMSFSLAIPRPPPAHTSIPVPQLLWLGLAYWMLRIMKKAGFLSQGALVLRMSVNAKLNMVRQCAFSPFADVHCPLSPRSA